MVVLVISTPAVAVNANEAPFAAVFVLTLALYLGYRYLIFGSITPVFYGQIQHGLLEFLFGLPVYLKYLFSPVNQVVIGSHGAAVATAVMVVSPLDGTEEIANPFTAQADAVLPTGGASV